MNLKVYTAVIVDRMAVNQPMIFNTSFITNIEADGTGTTFMLKDRNIEKLIAIAVQYDDVVQDVGVYNYGIKISIPVTGIDNHDANQTVLMSIESIVYGWSELGSTRLLVTDSSIPREYKTNDSLSSIANKALLAMGLGETHIMVEDQSSITTDGLVTDYHKIVKNGSVQGQIIDLPEWTVASSTSLTYSGSKFWGGEQIMITL